MTDLIPILEGNRLLRIELDSRQAERFASRERTERPRLIARSLMSDLTFELGLPQSLRGLRP